MRAVNETGAAHVAEAAAAAGARLVHMSSDLVLDGRSAPYTDDAEAAPLDPYGASKAAGERAVLAAHPSPLVLRTSLVVDPYVPDRLSRSCLERMARGERVTLFTDEIRCPIARGTLARALVELAASAASGRLNVAGADAVSRHELGLLLLPRFGARDLSLVRAASAAEHPEPRPRDLRLDTSRARALLRTPLRGIREELSVPRS
jgi:dTDP-4-dehydrorhamnose reductase